ncbi:hypothetical protein BDR04DRAFT_1091412 [Suillus decipiens]|nr:hypothetical protein BDR04DRAFT_1091412 [Suillus decipiens]
MLRARLDSSWELEDVWDNEGDGDEEQDIQGAGDGEKEGVDSGSVSQSTATNEIIMVSIQKRISQIT